MPRLQVFGRRGGGVAATYAAVLDGVHLWLDVDGPVSVREVGTGEVTRLGDHPYDLGGLTGTTYAVLAGRAAVTLAEPVPSSLTRTPLAPDGRTRWEVARSDDGTLRLVRHQHPATAELDAVDLRGDRVHLRIRPHDGVQPGCHLLLLDTDDQVRATLPVTAHEGLVEALLGADDLPAGYFGVLRIALGTEGAWVRVRRRADDLVDPNHAVLLPELHEDRGPGDELDAGRLRARLRWNPDGLLALRSLDPDEAVRGLDGAAR